MGIPATPIRLMNSVYKQIFPLVHRELQVWKSKAESIPNEELRKQALASIEWKDFHCEGGAILSLIAEERKTEAIRFIIAYQTISDYLDNLCDRSTSMDPNDFEALHESMFHALLQESAPTNYYRFRNEQDDGGYLASLVETCQSLNRILPNYKFIKEPLRELCGYYCDLQVHKHVTKDERVDRLQKWFNHYEDKLPEMSWYEFSACSGSTLGIFCLISYALRPDFKEESVEMIRKGYFPYIQGLHIMLDYFIDQEEDLEGGDLNFCFDYSTDEEMYNRLSHFIKKADQFLEHMPHKRFHRLIHRGLLGLYLSDDKVEKRKDLKKLSKKLVRQGGIQSMFFYMNARLYRNFKKIMPLKARAT
jgi:tetraprenyl-beta-curcumene synthase